MAICDPSETDDDNDGFPNDSDICPFTDLSEDPSAPVLDGCSCPQILELFKPGENNGEKKKGCSQDTLDTFTSRTGWAKGVPRPPQ